MSASITEPLDLSALQTESRNSETSSIDIVSTIELCQIINVQDALVAPAVAACLPSVAAAIDAITERVRKGGRMISFGAGTSGRLGVLDASELPPTFHASPSQFIGLIAGGDSALRSSIEGAEDSPDLGAKDLLLQSPTPKDIVLGIASSGRTPYVLGALRKGREEGCLTIGIACTDPCEMGAKTTYGSNLCRILIQCITGAEAVTGSTRLKAGTATKMILNMISTGVMIKLGKTFGNIMVDLKTSNNKLRIRARNIIRFLCPDGIHTTSGEFIKATSPGSTNDEIKAWNAAADALIKSADGSVKLAILLARLGCGVPAGKQRLENAGGVLARALVEDAPDTVISSKEQNPQEVNVPEPLNHFDQRLVLCVDGGGTKTAAVIAELGGGILARGEAGISNFTAVGLNTALAAIRAATMDALASMPSPRFQSPSALLPSSMPLFTKVWVGIAGVDRPPEFAVLLPRLEDLFSLSYKDGSIRLTNDGFLLTTPIQQNPSTNEGVVVIAGTGSIAISYRAEDEQRRGRLVQIRRSGGWGHLLGDEGSAFMTGRSAIRSVLSAINNREELRSWHREILNHFAAPSEHQLISCVVAMHSEGEDAHEAENARKLRIAGCAGIVLRAYEAGDSAAAEVVKTTIRDLLGLIKPLIISVLHPEGVTPVTSTLCLGGGLMRQKSFWRLLVEEMIAVEEWRWNKVEVVEEPAAAGALWLSQET